MSKPVDRSFEFWHDYGSPASYLAWTQLPQLVQDTGARVVLRPMLLGGVFQATSNHSPATVPAKGKYLFVDLARFARRYGVPFVMNPYFMINTLTPMRVAAGLALRQDARAAAFDAAMYRAIWVEARNMNDPQVVAETWAQAGFDPAALAALAADAAVKDALKAATQEAVSRGVFGAPTFFAGDEMFWGQDRIDFVKEALKA